MHDETPGNALLRQVFELDPKETYTEDDLINLLADRISILLDKEPELLMSTLYRLDVLEVKILEVLNNPATPTPEGLAKLILERQRQKQQTRRKYSAGEKWNWDDI